MDYSPRQLAEVLASKALFFKSVVERELLSELSTYNATIKKYSLKEKEQIHSLGLEKSEMHWESFPLLSLYFRFHSQLMRMEVSNLATERKKGFSTFSDVYAQTVAYGLLAARWMSQENQTEFSLDNIRLLLPSTSDFLKDLFLKLLEVNDCKAVESSIREFFSVLQNVTLADVFGKEEKDPVIHFYEDFLDAYGKDFMELLLV